MKNAVLWDIKYQFIPHRKHITPPQQSTAGKYYVRFEVFTAVTMKNTVLWDINPSTYFTRNTLLLCNRNQPVNAL
jgi:hypothetical protein